MTIVEPQQNERANAPVVRRRGRDRVVGRLARLLARGFYRSVEIEGAPPEGGPVILAASHLNGFVDPVLMLSKLRMFPRFMAKATLWKVAVVAPLLHFMGVIPVHRRVDGAKTSDNLGTFDAAVAALDEGAVVAIFPEGTTHDDPTIRPIRTGVARIAIEAAAAGVDGIRIIPVGVSYEDKVSVRGRAIVHFGAPVQVPTDVVLLDERGDPDHEVVRSLTTAVQSAIEDVTPCFASTDDALALGAAAQITLRSDRLDSQPIPLARSAEVARRLARTDERRRTDLVDKVARYHMRLGFVSLRDEDLAEEGRRRLVRRVAWLAVLVAALSPLALAGLFINLIPVVLVVLAGLLPSAPVTKGTVRVLVAAIAFPVTWISIAWLDSVSGWVGAVLRSMSAPASAILGSGAGDRLGAFAGFVVVLLAPITGLITILLIERFWVLLRSARSWWTFVARRGQLAEVRERRDAVISATHEILDLPA